MSDGGSDDGSDEEEGGLELNPGFRLDMSGRIYDPKGPPARVAFHDLRAKALLAYLLLADDDIRALVATLDEEGFDDAMAAYALELGIILPPDAKPWTPIAPPRFELSEALLATCPPLAEPGPLARNPRIWVQTGDALPPELEGRVHFGPALWDRLLAESTEGMPSMSAAAPRTFAPERPVVWVEHPKSRVLQPYWLEGDFGDALRAVAVDGRPHEGLPRRAIEALAAAGVLVPKTPRVDRDAWVRGLRESLSAHRVAVFGEIASPLFVANLRAWAETLYHHGVLAPDRNQELREGTYCELAMMFLQHQLTPLINEVVPAPSEPTYTWLTRYRGGATLGRHTDRAQCRWNVSFDLGRDAPVPGSPPWKFFVETDGHVSDVALARGEAVLYSGTESPHWRHMLAEAQGAWMGLMHFVETTFVGPRR